MGFRSLGLHAKGLRVWGCRVAELQRQWLTLRCGGGKASGAQLGASYVNPLQLRAFALELGRSTTLR